MQKIFFTNIVFLIFFVMSTSACVTNIQEIKQDLKLSNKDQISMKNLLKHNLTKEPPRAVALVCHGLNLKPAKMDSLTDALNRMDVETFRVSLSGHRGSEEEMRDVTAALWLKEIHESYQQARKRADSLGLPLYYVGYSLGGLLGTMMLETELPAKVSYDKMLLLAPAVSLKAYTRLVLASKIFGKRFIVPNVFGLKDYLANRGVSVGGYDALFAFLKALNEKKEHKNINIPTLIFMDPRDELVSYSGIQDMIKTRKLDKWELVSIKKNPEPKPSTYAHIMIDPASIGQETWNQMMSRLKDFF